MNAERPSWPVYPQEQYESQKDEKPLKEQTEVLFHRRQNRYVKEGMRRSVRAVLMVHLKGHPHVLALKRENREEGLPLWELPGGKLRPGESERDGLNRKLGRFIYQIREEAASRGAKEGAPSCEWRVGELLAVWWRPNFDKGLFPYLPPHVTRPKECMKLYQVILPERCLFSLREGSSMVAVPLFDLFGVPKTAESYGTLLGALPQVLSRYALAYYEMAAAQVGG